MSKFEKVKKQLQDKTRGTRHYLTLTDAQVDARFKKCYKYKVINYFTNNVYEKFKTLKEVEEYVKNINW